MSYQLNKEIEEWKEEGSPRKNIKVIIRSIILLVLGFLMVFTAKPIITNLPKFSMIQDSIDYHNVNNIQGFLQKGNIILIILNNVEGMIIDAYDVSSNIKTYDVDINDYSNDGVHIDSNSEYYINGYTSLSYLGIDSWIYIRLLGYLLIIVSIFLLFYNPRRSMSAKKMREELLKEKGKTMEQEIFYSSRPKK